MKRYSPANQVSIFVAVTSVLVLTEAYIKPPSWKHCVKQLHAMPKEWQSLKSPGYPNGINTQMQCTWIISSNPKQKVRLAFQVFNLTGSTNNCYTQYIELFDMRLQRSKGKLCGEKRLSDYVAFGNQIRIDLLADTASEGHQGFMLHFRAEKPREKSGFTGKFSFRLPKPPRQKKAPVAKSPNAGKAGKAPAGNSGGGRVNLGLKKKQRQMTYIMKNVVKTRRNATGNSTKILVKLRKSTPHFTLSTTRLPPYFVQRDNHLPHFDKSANSMGNENHEDDINIYYIIGFAVGGFIFLIILIILIKLCFLKKKKKHPLPLPPPNYNMPHHGHKEFSTKDHLLTFKHPIQRRHELPMTTPIPHPPQPTTARRETLHRQPPHHGEPSRHGTFRRQPEEEEYENVAPLRSIGDERINSLLPPPDVDDTLRRLPRGCSIVPIDGGVVLFYPEHNAGVTQDDVRGDDDVTTFEEEERKKVPTLKRKVSEWEKEQLKLASRKL